MYFTLFPLHLKKNKNKVSSFKNKTRRMWAMKVLSVFDFTTVTVHYVLFCYQLRIQLKFEILKSKI